MRARLALRTGVSSLLILIVGSVFGHDMWLSPNRFVFTKGDTLTVHMLIGHRLEMIMESELLRTMTPTFDLVTPDSTFDLLGELPDIRTHPVVLPVMRRRLDFEGLGIVAMDHAFIYTQFETNKFLEYLEDEGLDSQDFLDKLGSDSNQTERYRRTFKSLIQVGNVVPGDLHARVLGQKIEILLLQNPYLLDPGDSLMVQVLFESAPLTDRLVTALHRNNLNEVSMWRSSTDVNGIARFRLVESGFWLIQTIQMRPSPDRFTKWESFWSSYSFWLD